MIVVLSLLAGAVLACSGSRAARQADRPVSRSAGEAVEIASETEAGSTWHDFTSEAGNFSLRFPAEPVERVNQTGDTAVHIFVAEVDQVAYLASYNDFPDIPAGADLKAQALELAFDQARDNFLTNIGASLDSEEAFAFEDFPGRHVTFSLPESGGSGVVRMVAVGNRFYQLGALALNSDLPQAEVEMFLESFALQETPAMSAVEPDK